MYTYAANRNKFAVKKMSQFRFSLNDSLEYIPPHYPVWNHELLTKKINFWWLIFFAWPAKCAHLWTHVINVNIMNFKNRLNKKTHSKSGTKYKNIVQTKIFHRCFVGCIENILWQYHRLLLLLLTVLRFIC